MSDLQTKTALVTGASRGIGRATALALGKAGARVIVHYGRSAAEAEDVVASIRANGGAAEAIGSDLSVPEGAEILANRVRSHGREAGCACAQRRNQQCCSISRLCRCGHRQSIRNQRACSVYASPAGRAVTAGGL